MSEIDRARFVSLCKCYINIVQLLLLRHPFGHENCSSRPLYRASCPKNAASNVGRPDNSPPPPLPHARSSPCLDFPHPHRPPSMRRVGLMQAAFSCVSVGYHHTLPHTPESLKQAGVCAYEPAPVSNEPPVPYREKTKKTFGHKISWAMCIGSLGVALGQLSPSRANLPCLTGGGVRTTKFLAGLNIPCAEKKCRKIKEGSGTNIHIHQQTRNVN